jgi:hypothetical protein
MARPPSASSVRLASAPNRYPMNLTSFIGIELAQ